MIISFNLLAHDIKVNQKRMTHAGGRECGNREDISSSKITFQ